MWEKGRGAGGGMGEGGWGVESGEWRIPVEGSGAVEELEVEGGRGLAVDFSAGAGLHGHCSFFFLVAGGGGWGVVRVCWVWRVGYRVIVVCLEGREWCRGLGIV